MVDLADYDLADVYRQVNGYGDNAYSWAAKNRGSEYPRRFDHVFTIQRLNATEASYLHNYDDLLDHTLLEVIFTLKGACARMQKQSISAPVHHLRVMLKMLFRSPCRYRIKRKEEIREAVTICSYSRFKEHQRVTAEINFVTKVSSVIGQDSSYREKGMFI